MIYSFSSLNIWPISGIARTIALESTWLVKVGSQSVVPALIREKGWFLYRDLPFVTVVYDLCHYHALIAGDSYLRSGADAQKRAIVDTDYGYPGNNNDMLCL